MRRLVMLAAGEASGDMHGAALIKAMGERDSSIFFCGIGGELMQKAGMRPLLDSSGLAVMGVSDVIFALPRIYKAYKTAKKLLFSLRPDLLILIDYPGFNLALAKEAKKIGIPVLYYISPKVWAWGSSRVKKIANNVDKLALIFPFELSWFQERGVDQAVYVGNPLMDKAPEFKKLKDDLTYKEKPLIGLLPGSRQKEIKRILPLLSQAAFLISKEIPGASFILSAAPGTPLSDMQAYAAAAGAPDSMEVVSGSHPVLESCDIVIAASGTVTMEAALAGVPSVLVYRVSSLTYLIGKALITVPYVGLANLIAGFEIMPELLQKDASPEKISEAVIRLLQDEEARLLHYNALREVRDALGEPGVAERTAELAFSILGEF